LSGLSLNWAARFAEASEVVERWRPVVEASHHVFGILGNRWVEAQALAGKGEFMQALTLLQEIIATCERVGEVVWWARSLNTVGWLYGELQDHTRALEWNTRGLTAGLKYPAPDSEIEGNVRLNLGDTFLALGRLDEAEAHFRWVEQVARNPRPQDHFMLWRYSQRLFHSYGELWLRRGDAAKALAYADECLA